jgi:peptidoglycan/LPS O-acetylase OafA/YrhL
VKANRDFLRNSYQAHAGRHIDSLTALRGVAAYLVVFSHCRRLVEADYFGEVVYSSPLRLVDAGTFGVVLFFALSGCTLYLSYGREPVTPDNVARFILRRIFRVYPAFLASLLTYAVLDVVVRNVVGFPESSWISTFGKIADVRIVGEYLSFSFNLFGHMDYFNNAYWSLPVEFQFYLLFPAFVVLLRIHPLALLLTAISLFAVNSVLKIHFLTFELAWQFVAGIAVAWFLQCTRSRLPNSMLLIACCVLLATALALSLYHRRLYYPPGMSDWTYLGGLAFPIVYLTALIAPPRNHIGHTIFCSLVRQGESSYSAYLYHNAFVVLGYVLIKEFQLAGALRDVVIYPLVLTGTYVTSHLSFRIVEQPGIHLGRRLCTIINWYRAPA